MRKIYTLIIIFAIFIMGSIPVFASDGIKIDGDFSDWEDKTSVVSTTPDSLALSKWHADSSHLNLFYEGKQTDEPSHIKFYNYIETENGTMKVFVNYNYKSEKADVTLYDNNDNIVWDTTYRSGNYKKDENRQLEIAIPIKYIVEHYESGYNIKISSDDNTVQKPIQISTASTLPYEFKYILISFVFIMIAVNVYVKMFYKKEVR